MKIGLCTIAVCIALNINAQNSDYKEANHVKEFYDNTASKQQAKGDVSGPGDLQTVDGNLLSISSNYPSAFSNNESEYYSNEILAIIFGGILVTLILGVVIIKFWE